MMKNTVKKVIAAAVLVGAVLVGSMAHAGASAWGTASWGGFHANVEGQSIRIPSGQLYHHISGSGFSINLEVAKYGSAFPVCDPSMRFTYGDGAYFMDGNVHYGCSMGGQWAYNMGGWQAPRGKACAELWAQEWKVLVARQCHYITG